MKSDKQKSDKQKRAKTELLRELESLRAQLAESAAMALADDEIPLLLDEVEQAIAEEKHEADQVSTPISTKANVLPGQQSLFDKSSIAEPVPPSTAVKPTARGENPFLPKHIRDRLDERRRALAENISETTHSLPSTTKSDAQQKAKPPDTQTLIDELVADYLPRIEAELRWRLAQRLEQSLKSDSSGDEPD